MWSICLHVPYYTYIYNTVFEKKQERSMQNFYHDFHPTSLGRVTALSVMTSAHSNGLGGQILRVQWMYMENDVLPIASKWMV